MSEITKRLAELSNDKASNATKKLLWLRANRDWLKKSAAITYEVLVALDEKQLTQKQLAELMNVSPQYISNLVKGSENLTLEAITKLEKALGIELMKLLRLERRKTLSPDTEPVTKTPNPKTTDKKAA